MTIKRLDKDPRTPDEKAGDEAIRDKHDPSRKKALLGPVLDAVQRVALVGKWRHKGTGHIYEVTKIGRIEATLKPGVIYERRCPTCFGGGGAQLHGSFACRDQFHNAPEEDPWIRSYDEFIDGRFEKLG